jgi:hypothetical protein
MLNATTGTKFLAASRGCKTERAGKLPARSARNIVSFATISASRCCRPAETSAYSSRCLCWDLAANDPERRHCWWWRCSWCSLDHWTIPSNHSPPYGGASGDGASDHASDDANDDGATCDAANGGDATHDASACSMRAPLFRDCPHRSLNSRQQAAATAAAAACSLVQTRCPITQATRWHQEQVQ